MGTKWYVMHEEVPYNWQRAEIEYGPYYSISRLLDRDGYATEQEAEDAVEKALNSDLSRCYGPFFIIRGYIR